MTDLGRAIRLSRLFRPDGRCALIAFDHAIAHGVLRGLSEPGAGVQRLVKGRPDGVVLQKGIARRFFAPEEAQGVSLVLKLTSYSPHHWGYDSPTASIEEAVQLGADAASVGVIVGRESQREQTRYLAEIVRQGWNYGMPVGAHIYPRPEDMVPGMSPQPKDVAYAVRVGAELGIDFVKTNWTGSTESFAEVVAAAGIPVLVAGGGPKGAGVPGLVSLANAALEAGGAGVAFGRGVWQDDDVVATVEVVVDAVHAAVPAAREG